MLYRRAFYLSLKMGTTEEFLTQERIMIGGCELDVPSGRITSGDRVTRLDPKSVDVLMYLVKHQNQLVSKEQLIEVVWQDRFITDAQVSKRITEIRQALGDVDTPRRFIETLPKRGYRLVCDVQLPVEQTPEIVSQETTDTTDKSSPLYLGLLVGFALLAALGLGLIYQSNKTNEEADPVIDERERVFAEATSTVLVKPFVGQDNESLAQIFSAEVAKRLSRHAELYVVSPAALEFVPAALGPPEVRQELQADVVVNGQITKQEAVYQLDVELVDAEGFPRWRDSVRFGLDGVSIAGAQRRVSEALARELDTRHSVSAYCEPTHNLEALEAYHEASVLIYQIKGRPNYKRAEQLLRKALELDPDYAHALEALAYATFRMKSTQDHLELGLTKDISRQALEQCPTLGLAYLFGAPVYQGVDNIHINWELRFRDALALDPNNIILLDRYAHHLIRLGRIEQARTILNRAFRNNTYNPRNLATLAWTYTYAHEFDSEYAIELAQRAKAIGDKSCNADILTAMHTVFLRKSRAEVFAAQNAIPDYCRMGPDNWNAELWLDAMSNPDARRQILDEAEGYLEQEPNSAFADGVMLSDPDLAHRALREAIDNGRYFHRPAFWDGSEGGQLIRRDPRFVAIVQELGYDTYWREFGWPSNNLCSPYGESIVCDR